ncbi:hypothetical protein NO559_07880 [Dasania sp. GY-MA-18]|uniref:Uncharacterized protein n=1 Tax=Dasania phycosphaerae TaxID=2950436 RepID=A0A9J6RKT7_9GAMM|nr:MULTISPECIES: hypothetical protein [Dasania]MCR8922685.1 hypothetical protein [Dasania sp. GY-MA-18]MCZ0865115.1 hypothetical protein [Dasania phycosphaerae]MCZ0868841.1 hypothetical protein [Dasania phycosphaerae]
MRNFLQRFCANKPARLIEINDRPYLYRIYLGSVLSCPIYLHHFVSGDGDRAVHDHPFHGLSLVLAGSYFERVLVRMDWPCMHTTTRFVQFFNWIPADKAHQIIEPEPNTWTLFITGKHFKGWGFFEERSDGVTYTNRFGNMGQTPWWLTAPTYQELQQAQQQLQQPPELHTSEVETYPLEH